MLEPTGHKGGYEPLEVLLLAQSHRVFELNRPRLVVLFCPRSGSPKPHALLAHANHPTCAVHRPTARRWPWSSRVDWACKSHRTSCDRFDRCHDPIIRLRGYGSDVCRPNRSCTVLHRVRRLDPRLRMQDHYRASDRYRHGSSCIRLPRDD